MDVVVTVAVAIAVAGITVVVDLAVVMETVVMTSAVLHFLLLLVVLAGSSLFTLLLPYLLVRMETMAESVTGVEVEVVSLTLLIFLPGLLVLGTGAMHGRES